MPDSCNYVQLTRCSDEQSMDLFVIREFRGRVVVVEGDCYRAGQVVVKNVKKENVRQVMGPPAKNCNECLNLITLQVQSFSGQPEDESVYLDVNTHTVEPEDALATLDVGLTSEQPDDELITLDMTLEYQEPNDETVLVNTLEQTSAPSDTSQITIVADYSVTIHNQELTNEETIIDDPS